MALSAKGRLLLSAVIVSGGEGRNGEDIAT